MSGIIATYHVFESFNQLEKKAESIALGLTVGTWTDLPNVEKEHLLKHKGQVLHTEVQETYGIIKIFYPAINFESNLPSILATVFGKLSLDGKIKLVDLDFTEDLLAHFPGPSFGIEGIRESVNVYHRPLLMSIFKGVIGRDISYIREHLAVQALSGVDFIKDDEILFDQPYCTFENRILAGKDVLTNIYETTGHRTRYAVNLTGPTFQLKEKAKRGSELGADIFLFNVFTYGLDVLQSLVEDPDIQVPIMAHPAFAGSFTSSPYYGLSTQLVLGKLLRLVGADFSLFPTSYGSVTLQHEEMIRLKDSLTKDTHSKKTIPVPSAGIHPGLVPTIVKDFGMDCVINAGGGIHGHPDGTIAGGKAFRQAIHATVNNISLQDAAKNDVELNKALQLWGN